MNRLMVALSLVVLTFGAAAETYTWTGGTTMSGDWTNPSNWSSDGGVAGVPGGGDTAVISDEVTFTSGIVITDDELVIKNTAAVTISGVVSGTGALRNDSTVKLTLSGDNAFTGGMYVNGPICLKSATALGVLSMPVEHKQGEIFFSCAGATYAYDIKPLSSGVAYYYTPEATGTLDGSIANDGIDWFSAKFVVPAVVENVDFAVTGQVAVRDATHGSLEVKPKGRDGQVRFLGGVKIKRVFGDATNDGKSMGWISYGGICDVLDFTLAFTYGLHCLSDSVFGLDTVLNFGHNTNNDKDRVDLNGWSQTANRLVTAVPGESTLYWSVDSASPATLTLKPTESSLQNYAYLQGGVSLVMAASDSEIVQIFQGRASTTTGDLVVSNGILRIADGASFPNVTKVAIANGGTLDVTSARAAALGGVTALSVESGGTLSVEAAAFAAFGQKTMALSVESGATVSLGRDVTLTVATLSIDGVPQRTGTYPFGDGVVVVPSPVSPTSTGVWTGGGDTSSSLDQKNWEGGYPGEIDVTFATGGTQATLEEDLLVGSVAFALPAGAEAFEVMAAEGVSAKLSVAGNLSMTAGSAPQTATVSAPIVLRSMTPTVNVSGADDTLVLNGPIIQGSVAMTLTKTGPGTLYLNAQDSSVTSEKAVFNQGTVYLKGGALGGTPEVPLQVDVNIPDKASPLYLTGGIFNQKFSVVTAQNGVDVFFAEGTTNVVNGKITVQNNNRLRLTCQEGSMAVLNGGYGSSWVNEYEPTIQLCAGSTLVLTNSPAQVGNYANSLMLVRSAAVGRQPDEQNVYLGAQGSDVPTGVVFAGPMRITFVADDVFVQKDATGSRTPLQVRWSDTVPERQNPTIIDLNGHNQSFAAFVSTANDSQTSYFTSAEPATLSVGQNVDTVSWKPAFCGAVSLKKGGANTLTLAGVSPSTGRLEVSEGRLDFAAAGAWTNLSEVAVSGGVLAVDLKSRLKARADYYLSGGKLEIAAGVRLVAANLYVPDGKGGWTKMDPGTYTAVNFPDFIAGEGSLHVRGGGLMMIFR